jgi:hypothetical protein
MNDTRAHPIICTKNPPMMTDIATADTAWANRTVQASNQNDPSQRVGTRAASRHETELNHTHSI